MKKTLTILTILVIALVAMVGSVNAAVSVGVEPEKTQKVTAGQQVKVTVNSGEGKGVQYQLAYDTAKFTFDETTTKKENPTITSINPNYKGTGDIFVVALSTNQTLIFKAKEDMEVPAGSEAQVFNFSASNLKVAGTEGGEAGTGSLTIEPATPTTPTDPTKPTDPTTPTKPTEKGAEKVGTNGEVINKLPQTGAPLYIGAGVAVALVGAVLVIRKIRK